MIQNLLASGLESDTGSNCLSDFLTCGRPTDLKSYRKLMGEKSEKWNENPRYNDIKN